jgi:succinoglycan biosynthesis transport protein ExoP
MAIPGGGDREVGRPKGEAGLPVEASPRPSLWQVMPAGPPPPAADDADLPFHLDLLVYGRILLKYRWTILISILVALMVGAGVTYLMRPVYTAQATLQIDREAAKVVNVQDVTPSDELVAGEEFFQTQYGLLRSKSLAQKVDESLGLSRDDAFIIAMDAKPPVAGPRLPASALPDARRGEVLALLRAGQGVVPVRGSRLVSVTFASPNPALSAKIANAFAENFIGANLDRRFESASYAKDFLERRLAQVKTKLEDSERQLVAYATSQGIIQLSEPSAGGSQNPGEQTSLQSANLGALNSALATAKTQRIQAEQRWRQAQATPGLGLAEILQSPTVQQLTQTRARLVTEYQDKLRVFKPDYPDMQQLKAQIEENDRQLAAEAQNIRASLQAQYVIALNNEKSLNAQVNGLKGDVLDLRSRSIQYNILQREVDTNRTLYDGLLQRYKEVGVAGGVTNNNISVVDRADPPALPSSPKILLNMLLAAIGGVVLGVLLAFAREMFDQAIRVPSDVEGKIGLPVLGIIPLLAKGVQPAQALAETRSPMSEAYHSLRSALQFSTADGFPSSLLITSPRPSEGKSTTAIAISQNMARLGFRTLLVDADLRDPSLHKTMGADNRAGLSNILTGAASLTEVLQETDLPDLFIIPSGPLPPNPAELLASTRLQALIGAAGSQFDMVVFDGPPVMGLADAPMIGSLLSGALLVIESGRTVRLQVRAAVKRLEMANVRVLGTVLTKFNARKSAYGYGQGYGYEYDYNYGHQPGPSRGLQAVGARARRLMNR